MIFVPTPRMPRAPGLTRKWFVCHRSCRGRPQALALEGEPVWGLEFTLERVGSQKEQITRLCGCEVLGLGPLPYPASLHEVRHLARAA